MRKSSLSFTILSVSTKIQLKKVVYGSGLIETSETKCEFMQHNKSEWLACYSQKALHDYFISSWDKNVDELASSYWLTKGGLAFETEGLLIAAQDQVLNTRAMQQVYLAQCRLCNTQAVITAHLISGCSQLAGTQYKLSLQDIFIGVYMVNVILNATAIGGGNVLPVLWKTKILWDFNIFVDHFISTKRHDIVVINKDAGSISLIDMAVPADKHISIEEEEKFTKYDYQDLRIELEKLWKKKITMMSIVANWCS